MRRQLLIFVFALTSAASSYGKELVANGSFEQGQKIPTGWTGSEGARWEEGGKTGKCAVLGPAPKPEAWVTWKQAIENFKPHTTYLFSAWVKADRPAYAQVVIEGLKPHKAGISFFYMKVDATWRQWVKQIIGEPGSSPTVTLILLNEGGLETFYYDDVSFTVREEVDIEPVPVKKAPEVMEGREPGDLISNGRFELGDHETPLGWYHGDAGLMPRTTSAKYFYDPAKDTGAYAWESTGFSGRSVSVTVPKGDGWGGWSSQLHDIKPNTKYTVEFWYRMSRKGALRMFLFGRELAPQDMLELNPRHWWRYTATLDSGNSSGDCNIGFVVEGNTNAATKAWIDNVELFEGVSPLGTNVARLEHYYYDFTWVSPAVVSPVPFAFEWCFEEGRQPDEIGYVVELPKELELTGYYVGRLRRTVPWSMVWTNPDTTARLEKQETEYAGVPYVRYTFYQKQDRSGAPKSFGRDGYVPVDARNNWKTYGGTTALMLYVLSRKESGESSPGYYYATWKGGEQRKQKLTLRLTRIPQPARAKKMILLAEHGPWAIDQEPRFVQDRIRLGLTGSVILPATHPGSAKDPSNVPKTINEAKQRGLPHVATWTNMPAYGSGDPNARAMGLDFQRSRDNFCLEYRGSDWKKRLDELKALLDSGYNTFLFDDAFPSTCYCARCKQVFKSFLKEQGLDYVSPGDFLAPDWTGDSRFKELWEDFPLYHYGKTAEVLRNELEDYVKAKGLKTEISLGVSSWLRHNNPVAASSMKSFTFDASQTYINWALETFKGSPRLVGDYLRDRQLRLGKYALPLVPTISPGLGYMSQLCSLDPHEQMKYQILEMMMAPNALGYTVYAGSDYDLGDMKFTAEANAILTRFEDLITRGELVPNLSARGTDQSTVRAKKLGDEMLVLVSDYSTYDPIDTEVSFDLPGVKSLVDVETNEAFKPVEGVFKITLKTQRLRMLHGGTRR